MAPNRGYGVLPRRPWRHRLASSDWPGTGSNAGASPGTADTTTWAFDEPTGLLSSKTDDVGKAVTYTYTQAGQIATREWARILTGTTHVKTTYGYDSTTGELTTVDYNDSTPDLTYTYNRLGHQATVTDVTGTRTFNYNLSGTLELQNEILGTSGSDFYGDHRITRDYDTATGAVGRYNRLSVGNSSDAYNDYELPYDFDASGRMNYVAPFTYAYLANSNLVETVTRSSWNYTDTRAYDSTHDWMASRTTTISSTTKAAFAYTHDAMGRITQVARTGEVFDRYGNGTQGLDTFYAYDDRSQVIGEKTKLGGSATVLTGRDNGDGTTPGFAYDPMGNRSSSSGTTHNGNAANYTTNALNQYTQRTVPGVFDVAGAAGSGATVTVNGSASGVTRHGEYFFQGHALTNTSAPVFSTLTVSDGITPFNLLAFLALTPESFTYDDDGNMLTDGRWSYTYDAENRLIAMETLAAAYGAGAPRQKLQFAYDYLGRRVDKLVSNWGGSAWSPASELRFVYDGWNVLLELDQLSSLAIVRLHVWGLDLSGTLQGAGGVGGLLYTYDLVSGGLYVPAYDAQGNLHGMIDKNDGSLAAAYEYDAFGNTLRESGPYAASNPFRFATKYADVETGLVQYNTRYYSPSLGRFLNRDTISEQGGLNLYAYCGNNGVNGWDVLGMDDIIAGKMGYHGDDPHLITFLHGIYDTFGGGAMDSAAGGSPMAGQNAWYQDGAIFKDNGMGMTLLMQGLSDFASAYDDKHPFDGNNTPTSTRNSDGSITYNTIRGDLTVTAAGNANFDDTGQTLVGARLAPNAPISGGAGGTSSTTTGTANIFGVMPNNDGVGVKWVAGPRITNANGSYEGYTAFTVPKGANGVIVQQVKFDGKPTYWEAWTVSSGVVQPSKNGINDMYINRNPPIPASGVYSERGLVQFYPNATMQDFPELQPKGVPYAGQLNSSWTQPVNWVQTGALSHDITVVGPVILSKP